MKKLELKGKLNLNKETVTKLNNVELNNVKGGGDTDLFGSRICPTWTPRCQANSTLISNCC